MERRVLIHNTAIKLSSTQTSIGAVTTNQLLLMPYDFFSERDSIVFSYQL